MNLLHGREFKGRKGCSKGKIKGTVSKIQGAALEIKGLITTQYDTLESKSLK
jgi:hypothetical protein